MSNLQEQEETGKQNGEKDDNGGNGNNWEKLFMLFHKNNGVLTKFTGSCKDYSLC